MSARSNSFDPGAARDRCLKFRRRILDISQQVSALHIGSAYSCTEIVDVIYYGLMRRNADGSSAITSSARHSASSRSGAGLIPPKGNRSSLSQPCAKTRSSG